MTLLCDAGPLVALADRLDPMQQRVAGILRAERGPLVIPSPVTAEVDYMLATRLGTKAREAFLEDLAAGRFLVECPQLDEYRTIVDQERRYEDLGLGLADLSLLTMARRLKTRRILTFDQRHFRAVRPLQGGSFTLLPADAA